MKRKELIRLVVAVSLASITVIALYAWLLAPKKATEPVEIEVVSKIESGYNQEALNILHDQNQARNFNVPVDLTTELGNPQPFGR